jgi:hypothetical protein
MGYPEPVQPGSNGKRKEPPKGLDQKKRVPVARLELARFPG